MSKLKFFKGKLKNLPKNKTEGSFYIAEDTYDIYYAKNNQQEIKLFTNPKYRIKDVQTYYSIITNEKPALYPPSSDWTLAKSNNFGYGQSGAKVTCIIYMDGHYEYSEVDDLITFEEIDFICNNTITNNKNTSVLHQGIVGEMILNTGGDS